MQEPSENHMYTNEIKIDDKTSRYPEFDVLLLFTGSTVHSSFRPRFVQSIPS